MKLTIYRITGFLLVPVAILFSISLIILIATAFANPAMLLPLILIGCIVVYTFASLKFLIKGIDGKKYLGSSAKNWLKISGHASLVFAILLISQCILFLIHPYLIQQLAQQAEQTAGSNLKISEDIFENYVRGVSYFFLIYAVVLFLHILLSLQYIKLYNYLFKSED